MPPKRKANSGYAWQDLVTGELLTDEEYYRQYPERKPSRSARGRGDGEGRRNEAEEAGRVAERPRKFRRGNARALPPIDERGESGQELEEGEIFEGGQQAEAEGGDEAEEEGDDQMSSTSQPNTGVTNPNVLDDDEAESDDSFYFSRESSELVSKAS